MPELPEVETTRRGISPWVIGRPIVAVRVHDRRLRWPVPRGLERALRGDTVLDVARRAKYLLLGTGRGTLIVHLGMSGSLRLAAAKTPRRPHDHVEFEFEGGTVLRLHDPRRFGAVLWTRRDPMHHRLLAGLGPEPLGNRFDGEHLHTRARGRRLAVKALLMDAGIVAGVGNIYASEALYLAGIHPARQAGRISARRYAALAEAVRSVLGQAVAAGGTTLRDFVGGDGEPGRFRTHLHVYGRAGEACGRCGHEIRQRVLAQRASYYCPRCQH